MARRFDKIAAWLGTRLSRYLSQTHPSRGSAMPVDPARMLACLQVGDVLLVEGLSRVSVAIKYLTQSTWSHAALYAGHTSTVRDALGRPCQFLEADIGAVVRAVNMAEYEGLNSRICRPIGLNRTEIEAVIGFVMARLGDQYDLKNVFDLARYLLPVPPVPVRWRWRMLAPGSGDPTRAICSTLTAQAFQSVRYPILPIIESVPSADPDCARCADGILHVRHHSLFVPRDFDISPCFAVVKPSLVGTFDPRSLRWGSEPGPKTVEVGEQWRTD